jgi:Competence protein CoiA-like family
MTLSAINKRLELFNPSALIELGRSRENVVVAMREGSREGLFCPHCFITHGSMVEVRFRNSERNRVHFYHAQKGDAAKSECVNQNGESERHLSAKTAIASSLMVEGLVDAKLEYRLLTPGLAFRRPDIYITRHNGAIETHEIQISYISAEEIRSRTADQKAHGSSNVVWYLFGKVYSLENRSMCEAIGATVYHLWFVDGDIAKPKWRLAPRVEEETGNSQTSNSLDRCSQFDKIRPEGVTPSGEFDDSGEEEVYPNDSKVFLRTAKGRIYTVLSSFVNDRDTEMYGFDPYYKLMAPEGYLAYWNHKQLKPSSI